MVTVQSIDFKGIQATSFPVQVETLSLCVRIVKCTNPLLVISYLLLLEKGRSVVIAQNSIALQDNLLKIT